jgi:hypothetical protein
MLSCRADLASTLVDVSSVMVMVLFRSSLLPWVKGWKQSKSEVMKRAALLQTDVDDFDRLKKKCVGGGDTVRGGWTSPVVTFELLHTFIVIRKVPFTSTAAPRRWQILLVEGDKGNGELLPPKFYNQQRN